MCCTYTYCRYIYRQDIVVLLIYIFNRNTVCNWNDNRCIRSCTYGPRTKEARSFPAGQQDSECDPNAATEEWSR